MVRLVRLEFDEVLDTATGHEKIYKDTQDGRVFCLDLLKVSNGIIGNVIKILDPTPNAHILSIPDNEPRISSQELSYFD